MSDLSSFRLRDLFSTSIPGEWGSEPVNGENALVIRAADFTKDCKLRLEIGAPRNIPIEKLGVRALKNGDLLIEKSGGSPDQPVGRVVLFDRENEHITYTHSNFIQLLRTVDWINPRFVHYLMLFCYENGLVFKYQQQTTGIINLKLEDYLKEQVIIPSLPEVRDKISTVLYIIDQTIEKTEALIEKYQQIKAGLMHDLFTRGVTADGKLRPTREQAPELYQETPIGWIPNDWKIKTVSELANQGKGSTVIGPFGSDLVMSDYRTEGTPVVFVRDVKEDKFHWVSNVFVSSKKAQALFAHRVKPGDILATKMGLPPCIAAVYPEDMPMGIITADMIRMTPDTAKVDPNWLSAALNYDRTKRRVAAITAGVTRPKVTLSDFRSLKLAVPQPEEQKNLEKILTANLQVLRAEEDKLQKLRKQKKGLMLDLLTGNFEVKVEEPEAAHV